MHQALFGYDAGHNLLASSCDLTSDSRRILAPLTDATGPWPTTGFEQVYTGVPLPDMPFYALFCTWPAPEMHRPGCVWSHVLLIELTDLASIKNLGGLRPLFRRPVKSKEKPYRNRIAYLQPTSTSFIEDSWSQKCCEAFLSALYEHPESQFTKETPRSSEYEDLVFALWSQQWPKLRRNFAFSTGSFADRSRIGIPFDLQLMPTGTLRSRQQEETISHQKADNPKPLFDCSWLTVAREDLSRSNVSGLRSFLTTYGADVDGLRNAFTRLVTVFHQWRFVPDLTWTTKFHLIAELFPQENDAIRLKESLLTADTPSFDLERAWAATSFLLNSKDARAFSKVSFDHQKLMPRLWQWNKVDVLRLLARVVRRKESGNLSSFATAISHSIDASDLQTVLQDHPELIPILIGKRPSLAFELKTWELPETVQWQIHEVLDTLALNEKDWSKILAAKFIAATGVAVRETVARAGDYVMEGAFRWLDTDIAKNLLPSQIWREAIATSAAKKLNGKEALSPQELAFCTWFVEPDVIRGTLSAARSDVVELAKQGTEALPQPLRKSTAFLLVTLGLRHSQPDAVKLILCGYFDVYEALAKSSYPWESWILLGQELPLLESHWPQWDNCERLRRGVRDWLLKYCGSGKLLLDAAHDDKTRQIARDTLSLEEPREFLD